MSLGHMARLGVKGLTKHKRHDLIIKRSLTVDFVQPLLCQLYVLLQYNDISVMYVFNSIEI